MSLDADIAGRLIALRRDLHRHPELSNEERETQGRILKALEAAGLPGARTAAGTGLVLDLVGEAGPSNRKVLIRADIDALPIEEASGEAFASVRPGVMHACGHDAHTAMAVAAAEVLARRRQEFRGTVRIVFQPAEEAEPLGGRRVVEEGLLDDVEAAIGIHVDPYLETGRLAVGPGSYTLASDIFDITVTGRSAHAAKPHEGVDALAVGAALVGELQKLVARETDPFASLIVSVTGFSAGGAYNIVADRALLRGTIRSGNASLRARAQARLREVAEGIAKLHRAEAEVAIVTGEPPVVNDPDMVAAVERAGARVLGEEGVVRAPGWTAADDFGFYSQKRPSVYFRLGIRNEALGAVHALHHPAFKVDEAALPLGAEVLVATALDVLGQ